MLVAEPASLSANPIQSDGGTVGEKNRSSDSEDSRAEDMKVLMVSSSRSDRAEARVSSSAYESRCIMQSSLLR